MKLGKHLSETVKVTLPLAPMIAVAFQLLIFFILHLKLLTSQGNYNINMPISAPMSANDRNIPEIRVSLRSDRNGNLTQLTLGSRDLGNDEAAFERLNREILAVIGRPGNPLTKDIEAEIDADFETPYKYVVKAISKCTGRLDPETGQIARYIEKIKFAPPHKPKG